MLHNPCFLSITKHLNKNKAAHTDHKLATRKSHIILRDLLREKCRTIYFYLKPLICLSSDLNSQSGLIRWISAIMHSMLKEPIFWITIYLFTFC